MVFWYPEDGPNIAESDRPKCAATGCNEHAVLHPYCPACQSELSALRCRPERGWWSRNRGAIFTIVLALIAAALWYVKFEIGPNPWR